MKTKIAFLALPIVLAALVFGVKWRAEHPPATKEDLAIRAIILRSSLAQVLHLSGVGKLKPYESKLSKNDINALADSFYLSPQHNIINQVAGTEGTFFVSFYLSDSLDENMQGVFIELNANARKGKVAIGHEGARERNLHPATVKRWMGLLLSHPRIGPELRERIGN